MWNFIGSHKLLFFGFSFMCLIFSVKDEQLANLSWYNTQIFLTFRVHSYVAFMVDSEISVKGLHRSFSECWKTFTWSEKSFLWVVLTLVLIWSRFIILSPLSNSFFYCYINDKNLFFSIFSYKEIYVSKGFEINLCDFCSILSEINNPSSATE